MGWTLGLWISLCPFTAHGDLDEKIQEVTRRIAGEPANAELYLQRGELHRLHADGAAATADYARALELNPGLEAVELARGRLSLESGDAAAARAALDRFLVRKPGHADAVALRARALARLGEAGAAAEFTRAIALAVEPGPDLYLERAAALQDRPAEALAGLEDGLRSLGPVPALVLAAVDLDRRAKRFDAALGRGAAVEAASPRRETWLVLRGEILAEAGRPAEARAAFAAALAALEALPPRPRRARATVQLEARVRASMEDVR
jgi:predicted Zn-dependent protease